MSDVAHHERLVCFLLGEHELGVPIREVKETIEPRPITPLFLVPELVAGLINLRGEVVAVLDLASLLGLERKPLGGDNRIVVLRGRAPGRPPAAGLLVDRLAPVRDLDPASVRPVPATVPAEVAGYLRGMARVLDEERRERPLLVLDLERVLECERLKAFRQRPTPVRETRA